MSERQREQCWVINNESSSRGRPALRRRKCSSTSITPFIHDLEAKGMLVGAGPFLTTPARASAPA